MSKNRSGSIAPAGYSGTPLAKKLGIKAGNRVFVAGAPKNYLQLLAPLPAGVTFASSLSATTDVAHLFTKQRAELETTLRTWRNDLRADGAAWVSWPKKAAGVATDITENVIREVALPLGFVDIKVCAVDDLWSGLKLVIRRENRPARQ